MEKIKNQMSCIAAILKVLTISYIFSAAGLLLIAFLAFQLELSERLIQGGILLLYLLSTFLAGFIMGKIKKSRKFLWGLGLGVLYECILIAASFIFAEEGMQLHGSLAFSFAACAAGGLLGGMLS